MKIKNIMIVEDNPAMCSVISNSLYKNIKNIDIVIANTYKEALKYILDNALEIHLAVLDLNLPDSEDGDIVDYCIKKDIPSIVFAASREKKLMDRILEKDIIDYISKDDLDSMESLTSSVSRVLQNYDTNILLVDDSNVQKKIGERILKSMKLNVVTAKDGEEAFDIISRSEDKFSLVLTDYNMPKMDGMELTLKLREKFHKDVLGIIVLSASDKSDISTQFIKVGANDFINKPYNEIEVKTRVNANLELLELFERTRDMANKDFMTGAYNRRYFFETGEAIFDKSKRDNKELVVAMFDIDKFKSINDTYGHDIGDIAICEVADILNKNLRTSDLMARFGGEEFCVLLENITLEDTEKLFEKIRVAFEKNVIKTGDLKIQFTTSIGVCYGLQSSLEDMIKVADEGLYYCKNNGRNQVAINKKL